MTSILSRSPLQHMSMNSASHTGPTSSSRRRSARHLDHDNEDGKAPPTKRVKSDAMDASNVGAATKTNGAVARKGKKAYEESDDGFTFSRGKTKRGASRTVSQDKSKTSQATAQSDAGGTQSKRGPRKTLPSTPGDEDGPKPRRSKRLSGESDAHGSGQEDPFRHEAAHATKKTAATQKHLAKDLREDSPAMGNGGEAIHIPKRRETKIGLLFSETPVIRRNKALRQISHDSNRRSSASLRGKRASSMIDAGTSSSSPHAEVRTEDFYKHISQDLMEPRRMKQLLVWCGNRALGEKLKLGEKVEDAERQALHAARVVQEELVAEFANRNDLSNWFDRPDDPAPVSSLVKKPNPRNVQNAAKLAELETELARLQVEKTSWDALAASVPARASASQSDTEHTALDPKSINPSLLSPPQAALLSTLLQPAPDAPALQTRLDAAASDLQFKLDSYHDSVHRLERYVATSSRVADDVLASAAGKLEERDAARQDRAAAGAAPVRQGDVLRALGKALDREGPGSRS